MLRPPTPIRKSEALEATLKKLELGNESSLSMTQSNLHSRNASKNSINATTPRVAQPNKAPVA